MSDYTILEKSIRRVKQFFVPYLSSYHRKRINNTDFTIISNNCWGGLCYEYFGLPKNSPTIGAYFFSKDYVKFVSNLNYYLNMQIEIIPASMSKNADVLIERNQKDIPVGVLDDVEIIFLHYRDPKTAKEKWIRRCQRVNYNNLIFKFSNMGKCSREDIKQFMSLKADKKFMFSATSFPEYDSIIIVPGNEDGSVNNDTFYWNKYIDVYELINSGRIVQK